MKRILYVGVIAACVASHYFVAREEMDRNESLLKVPPFTAVEYKSEPPSFVNPVIDAPIEQVENALLPLLDSESVEKAAALLKGVSEARAREIVDVVFSNAVFKISQLNRRLFVAAVAEQYKDKPKELAAFFEILLKYPDLYQGEPFIYTLIVNDYERAVPWVLSSLAQWEKEKKIVLPEGLKEQSLPTYSLIIEKNDAHAVSHLLEGQVPLDAMMATEFLWRAAALPKADANFVKLFIEKGAHLSYVKDGYTALMKAVANGNLPFVKALVEHGAPVGAMINPAVGTALQIANGKGLVEIEMYLLKHGARF
jgi:hypothetical protein